MSGPLQLGRFSDRLIGILCWLTTIMFTSREFLTYAAENRGPALSRKCCGTLPMASAPIIRAQRSRAGGTDPNVFTTAGRQPFRNFWNNPRKAALEFVQENPLFRIEEPPFVFNEGDISERVTYWPGAFIKRLTTTQVQTSP